MLISLLSQSGSEYQMRYAKALWVIFDGAKDCSVSEVAILYCTVLNANDQPEEFFIGLEDLKHAHSQGVLDATDREMTKYNVWLS